MEIDPECVPCLLNRVLYEAELCSPKKARAAVKDSLKVLTEGFEPGVCSAEVATRVHQRAYQVIGCADPYQELKARSDEVAKDIFPRAEVLIEASSDRLETAVMVSIAGNVMDYGIAGLADPTALSREFDSIMRQGLNVNDLTKVKGLLKAPSRIVYLLDNCGEDVLDVLLVRELRARGAKVVGVVKGEPILTDVTLEDAQRSGVVKEFDDVLTTGMFAVGLNTTHMGDRLRREMEEADLIISKGMANFESLSESRFGPILYLMRAKCRPVAEAIGASKNDNVARLMARPGPGNL